MSKNCSRDVAVDKKCVLVLRDVLVANLEIYTASSVNDLGLDGSEFDFLFSKTSRPALGTTHRLLQTAKRVSSSGIKQPGREADL